MASHVPKPININRPDETELKTLPQIGKFHAKAIIHACTKQGGRLMEDDFKSIPKLGAKVWQPLLDGKAITFGSPAPIAHCEPKSVSSNSSVQETQNQSKSSTDTAAGPPTQSTPVHIAQACFQFQPHYQKIQSSPLQPSASGSNQTPGLGYPSQGSADKALSQEAMAAEIAQIRQQLQFTKETLEDVWDCHSSEIQLYQGELESSEKISPRLKW